MSTPPVPPDTAEPLEGHETRGLVSWLTGRWARRSVWIVILLGFTAYLVFGSVSVVSYRYSPFLQQTFREVEQRGFFDIWTEQVRNLPTASPQWVVNGAFVVSIALVLIGVAYGTWLLLVTSGDESAIHRGSDVRSLRADG